MTDQNKLVTCTWFDPAFYLIPISCSSHSLATSYLRLEVVQARTMSVIMLALLLLKVSD